MQILCEFHQQKTTQVYTKFKRYRALGTHVEYSLHLYAHTFPFLQTSHSTKGLFSFNKSDIVWRNVIAFLYLHIAASYAVYLLASGRAQFITFWIGKWRFADLTIQHSCRVTQSWVFRFYTNLARRSRVRYVTRVTEIFNFHHKSLTKYFTLENSNKTKP